MDFSLHFLKYLIIFEKYLKNPIFKSILVILLNFLSYVDYHLLKRLYFGSSKNQFIKIFVSFFNLWGSKIVIFWHKNIEKVMFSIKMHYEDDIWTWGMYIYSKWHTCTQSRQIIGLVPKNPVLKKLTLEEIKSDNARLQ